MAYGTWFLQQKTAEDESLKKRVQDKMELLPVAAGVLVPPGYQLGDDYEFFGYTSASAERVRLHGAHPAAEGDRRRPTCRLTRIPGSALDLLAGEGERSRSRSRRRP